jgi:hypothetical protein
MRLHHYNQQRCFFLSNSLQDTQAPPLLLLKEIGYGFLLLSLSTATLRKYHCTIMCGGVFNELFKLLMAGEIACIFPARPIPITELLILVLLLGKIHFAT